MTPSPHHERLNKILHHHADELSQVFDSIQIIATLSEGENDISLSVGKGSFFSRWASTREVVLQWDEYTKENARQDKE